MCQSWYLCIKLYRGHTLLKLQFSYRVLKPYRLMTTNDSHCRILLLYYIYHHCHKQGPMRMNVGIQNITKYVWGHFCFGVLRQVFLFMTKISGVTVLVTLGRNKCLSS